MWMWRSVLCVSLVCGLGQDSNTIRSSKETMQQLDRSLGDQVDQAAQRQTETNFNSNRRPPHPCATPECDVPPSVHQGGRCSNRAQRRPSPQDRERERDTDTFNRTKAPEMSSCVRSGDCADGLCCVRYLTGKRCQRIPVEGEACLLQGSTKRRRNLGRCDCDAGLSCVAISRVESTKNKGQGVCLPRPRQGQRKTRHSGKKRTAERSCSMTDSV